MKINKQKRVKVKDRTFIWVNGNKLYLNPARKIPAMCYYEYINSNYWKARKLRYYHINKKECVICGETSSVQLHHLCYDPKKYGAEPDDDFVTLCRYHHDLFHKTHGGVPPKMKKKTMEYIKTMKQLIESNIDDLSWI